MTTPQQTVPTDRPDDVAAGRRSWAGRPVVRNLGLVVALALIAVAGFATGGERFGSIENILTILRLASIVGVLAIGMTFVVTSGGIDLSVGSVLGLSTVWATTLATQTLAEDVHWFVIVLVALAVGTGAGLINGVLIAYGRVVPFIMTLAMLAAARGLAEMISDRQTQVLGVDGFLDFFRADLLGIPVLVWIFALVTVVG